MSKNNVRVTVNLIDNFSETLTRLDEQLDKISRKVLTPHLEITGTGEVDNLKLKLESLDEIIEILTKVHGDGKIDRTKAKIESLSSVETVRIRVNDKQVNQAAAKLAALKTANGGKLRSPGDGRAAVEAVARQQRIRSMRDRDLAASIIPPETFDNFLASRRDRRRRGSGVGGVLGRLTDFFGGIGEPDDDQGPLGKRAAKGAYKWLIPKGQLTQDLFAFMMPFMAVLYTAIAGLAATMGATLAAGLSVGLLGLIGFGENAADSLHLAQVRMRLFGREMFKVFKPVTKTFAPIMDEFFARAPHALGRLTGSLQQLTAFVPALKSHGQGIINFVDALILKAVQLQPEISQVTSRFGQLMGTNLLNFFEWLVLELYNNQEAIIRVLSVGKSLLVLIYRIFMLWGFLFSVLQPVASVLERIANLFTNPLAAGITAATVTMGGFLLIASKALALLAAIKGMGMAAAFASLVAPIKAATAAMLAYATTLVGAAYAKALLIGLTVVGAGVALAAAAATMSAVSSMAPDIDGAPSGGGFGGGYGGASFGGGAGAGGGNTIIINGSYDRETQNRVKDQFPGLYQEEKSIDDSTMMPE